MMVVAVRMIWTAGIVLLVWKVHESSTFSPITRILRPNTLASSITTTSEFLQDVAPVQFYQHEDWRLSFRQNSGTNGDSLFLIHPVGIGMASWFWLPFMQQWRGNAVAVDLIGCGLVATNFTTDAWDPDTKGLFLPLDWSRACETLMKQQKRWPQVQKFTLVVQGGLAPLGVQLAHRNPQLIDRLVLCSPPEWKEMTRAVPESELQRNYKFLKSPIWGRLAFGLLESRWAVEFFSNAFLFREPCDSTWLNNAQKESVVSARPPVQAFNAGFLQHRSYETELTELTQPVLILEGSDDTSRSRGDYVQNMKNCRIVQLPGKNVLPWESPDQVQRAIQHFCSQ